MLEVLQLGGDTDTNCAIYGQLAGAYYGFDSIPKRWIDDLYLADEIIDLADRLTNLPSCPVLATRFEEDENYFVPPQNHLQSQTQPHPQDQPQDQQDQQDQQNQQTNQSQNRPYNQPHDQTNPTQPQSKLPNIYLDIDGVLAGSASPQDDVVEFATYLLDHYSNNLHWLTTHCKHGENNTLWKLKEIFDADLAQRLYETVKPTDWSVAKTDAIDFHHPFIWFDDTLFEFERKVLAQNDALNNFYQINPRDPKTAHKALNVLKNLDSPLTN